MSEFDRPRQESAPARRDRGSAPATRIVDSRGAMYRDVYEESQRSLDDQQDELKGMRDRAVQFTIFVGAATAFLVGTGLTAAHRDWVFYLIASVASLFSVVSVGLLLALLKPSKKHQWNYRLSSKSLIADWIESDVPVPTEPQFLRALAMLYDDMQDENEILLKPLRQIYQVLMVVGVLQLILWAALVWITT